MKSFLASLLLFNFIVGCSKTTPGHWSEFIPDMTPYVLIPQQGTTIAEMLSTPVMSVFDDLTPSAIQLAGDLEEQASSSIEVEAMLLYTDTSNDWQPVWITQSIPGFFERLSGTYQREFEQNHYKFGNHTIEKLFFSNRTIFVTEIGRWMIISESSLGIENILRTARRGRNAMNLDTDQIAPGSFIVNTEGLDSWAQQLAQVAYRPYLKNIFEGGNPISFQTHEAPDDEWMWRLQGEMVLKNDRSLLIESISSEPEEFFLDRFIPANTSAFSIFRLAPVADPPENMENNHEADQYIMENPSVWHQLASYLDNEVAFASFPESGATSTSEFLFLRKINNAGAIRSILDGLDEQGVVIKQEENTYIVQSTGLAHLFGSNMNPVDSFYLTVHDEIVVMARERGLAMSIGGDASRRRVMFYSDDYRKIRNSVPGPLSSLLYVDAERFERYIQPWLNPQSYFGALITNLDQFVITTHLQPGTSVLDLSITSFQREVVDEPYREQWMFPLEDTELTGQPVFTDVGGTGRNEVVFSTEDGNVVVLATDGTVALQTSTGNDRPVGSPVVYDWYGNNQPVIMQAAGNKVYAWNDTGTPLPNFPVSLPDPITTPLTVMDVTQNGVAEMVVATADRSIYILNARGQALSDWPQRVNAPVSSAPLITEFNGQRSLFTFAENTLHGWRINGQRREGFPVFMNTQMVGAPVKFNNHLIGTGMDGHLYSIGLNPLFTSNFSTTHPGGALVVQSVQVSFNTLNTTPSIQSVLMRDETGFYREDMILVQADNGSLFLYNRNGALEFTQSMGQPSARSFSPLVIDLDENERENLVALTDFGRLYAWDILSGQRLYDLPATGMKYPAIGNLFGNGHNEIVAQTRDGLQCWTILRTRVGD